MNTRSILITEQIKNAINDFLGTELIPICAIGNEMTFMDGNLMIRTFTNEQMQGWRKLDADGEITNIIGELCRN